MVFREAKKETKMLSAANVWAISWAREENTAAKSMDLSQKEVQIIRKLQWWKQERNWI